MKHIDLIVAEIRHGKVDDTTCTCRGGNLSESISEMVELIGIIQTRVALSIATGEVLPRDISADGEVLSRKCRPISRQKLARILEDMAKMHLTVDA